MTQERDKELMEDQDENTLAKSFIDDIIAETESDDSTAYPFPESDSPKCPVLSERPVV